MVMASYNLYKFNDNDSDGISTIKKNILNNKET